MKTKLWIVFFLFSLQLIHAQKFQYGIGLGLNSSNLIWNKPTIDLLELNFKYRTSYIVKAITAYRFNKYISVSIEPGYLSRGYMPSAIDTIGKACVVFNYVNLPILFHYNLIKKLNICIGPELSYLLGKGAKNKLEDAEILLLLDHKFDYGLRLGVQYNFYKQLTVAAHYYRGISSPYKSFDIRDINGLFVMKNRQIHQTFTLDLSYLFEI